MNVSMVLPKSVIHTRICYPWISTSTAGTSLVVWAAVESHCIVYIRACAVSLYHALLR